MDQRKVQEMCDPNNGLGEECRNLHTGWAANDNVDLTNEAFCKFGRKNPAFGSSILNAQWDKFADDVNHVQRDLMIIGVKDCEEKISISICCILHTTFFFQIFLHQNFQAKKLLFFGFISPYPCFVRNAEMFGF